MLSAFSHQTVTQQIVIDKTDAVIKREAIVVCIDGKRLRISLAHHVAAESISLMIYTQLA